jgi:carbamoyltransferase
MKILGICNANDSGAALIIDGKVIASANEERFTRQKLTRDFPVNAIEYVLKEGGLTLANIDWFGCGAWADIDVNNTLPLLIEDTIRLSAQGSAVQDIIRTRINATLKSDATAKAEFMNDLVAYGIPEEKMMYCDHHRSHALVAFYPSPFEDAIVLTADGRGDFRSSTLWKASRSAGLELLDGSSELVSLGAMYGFITKMLGFTPDRHEGKITGLAAYGKPTIVLEKMREALHFNPVTGKLEATIGDFYKPFLSCDLPKLKELLGPVPREDFAFAAQKLLEEVIVDYLGHHLKFYAEKSVNLCLAGGCMANVKLNYELLKIPQVKNIYVAPSMGDGGNALGGAVHVAVSKGKATHISMQDVYLGPSYSSEEIEKACKDAGLAFQKIGGEEKIAKVATLMHESRIIGWFQGRMEYGPRALGARSIIASAADPDINNSLNHRLNRTEFMPFAPVTIHSLAGKCFNEWQPDHPCPQFMTICYSCTPWMAEQCPAIVHIDNTARPQIVKREHNPEYHDVIKYYFELSGRPAIINTSFNHHEEPIVMSPGDAIRSYQKGNVDILVMGDYFVGL